MRSLVSGPDSVPEGMPVFTSLLVVFGGVSLGVYVVLVTQIDAYSIFGTVLGLVLPALAPLGICAIAYVIRQTPRLETTKYTLLTGLFGGCTGVLLGLLPVAYWGTIQLDSSRIWLVLFNTIQVGVLLGLVSNLLLQYVAAQESALKSEQARAETLAQELSVLNRVLRHDIRNVVTVIQGHASLLRDGETDVERSSRIIAKHATRLMRLSESAREFERIHQDETVPTSSFDLCPLVRDCIDHFEHTYPEATFSVSLPDEAVIYGSEMLEVAVTNVIENALEHNDAATPTVRVTAEHTADCVMLEIADNGPGIDAEKVNTLLRDKETALEHSSGLGIWLVNWIVTDLGGAVDFRANTPRGTIVRLSLPRAVTRDA